MTVVAIRPARWDVVVTVVLVLVLAVAALVSVGFAVLISFDGDACADVRCTYPVMSLGLGIATIGQPVAVVAGLVVLRRRQTRGRRMYPAPLIALVASAVALAAGVAIFLAGIPGASL